MTRENTIQERSYNAMRDFVNSYSNRIKPFFDKGQVDSVKFLIEESFIIERLLLGESSDLISTQNMEAEFGSKVKGYGNYTMALRLLKALYNEQLDKLGTVAKEKERGKLIERIDYHVKTLDKILKDNKFYQEQRRVA